MPMELPLRTHCVRYLSGSLLGMWSPCFEIKHRFLLMKIMFRDSMLCGIIKYGDQLRAWIDIGFSTAENN